MGLKFRFNVNNVFDTLYISESDTNNFASGYLATDLNGDGNVDLLDHSVLEKNINDFVFSHHP